MTRRIKLLLDFVFTLMGGNNIPTLAVIAITISIDMGRPNSFSQK
jgi:hypothetical protein